MATNLLSFKNIGAAKFANSGQVQLTEVKGGADFRAIAFQCGMNRDIDGAPTCYGPRHPPALDSLGNATNSTHPIFNCKSPNSWLWAGLKSMTKEYAIAHVPGINAQNIGDFLDLNPCFKDASGRFPIKQRAPQPAPGFYVSSTSTPADESYPEWDQRRYWNASEIPYQALTPALYNHGVKQGDFGLAIRNDNGMINGFFFADWGNKPKVGECSAFLFNLFFPNYPRENNERGVSYIVFPGSGIGPSGWRVPISINSTIRAQFRKLDDMGNSDELPLFIALGADISRLKTTLKNSNSPNPKFPTTEYERITRCLRLLWYPTDGNFHPNPSSPQLK
jgi:hypothetical protein